MFCFFIWSIYKADLGSNQIWDTLPTSKMRMIVAVGICKFTSSRLTILYSQNYPISVFICVSPSVNVWDALCDNSYCQCCIRLVNGVGRIVFHSMNFFYVCWCVCVCVCVCVSVICWVISLPLVPLCFTWFQALPACFMSFQLLPGSFSSFQVYPVRSMWFQLVLARFLI